MSHTCPVCGYPELHEPPYSAVGGGSHEICPSCGIHLGYEDSAGGDPVRRAEFYEARRQKWIDGGMKWHSRGKPFPTQWDPAAQPRDVAKP